MPLVRDLHGCFSSAARRDQRQLRRCELVHRAPDALDADLGDDALNNVIGDAVAVAVGVVFGAKLELLPYEGGTDAEKGSGEFDRRVDDHDLSENPSGGVLRPSPFRTAADLAEVQTAEDFDGLGGDSLLLGPLPVRR